MIENSVLKSTRCLYHSAIYDFYRLKYRDLGELISSYHGSSLTTTNESWEEEIRILKSVLETWKDEDAHIIFEYAIPRLGKRIDVVLLLKGIVFCLEFKVGKSEALQNDVEQVLDYALDLKNFHLYSGNKPIAPILIPTKYNKRLQIFSHLSTMMGLQILLLRQKQH